MPRTNPKLQWCIVHLAEDANWWVIEISDEVHWDTDNLGILDPRQLAYAAELCEPLREYGFDMDVFENAFFPFRIEKEEKKGRVRLVRTNESILEGDEPRFALPDLMDEEKGPYADLLDQVTRARVKLLNDMIDFEEKFTVDELEEDLRERQNAEYFEGKAPHVFTELTNLLEYVPAGYELEEEEAASRTGEEEIEDLPDFEDAETSERIEEDETMRWDEDDEKEFDEDDEEEEDEELDEDEEEDEAEEDEEGAPRKASGGSRRKR